MGLHRIRNEVIKRINVIVLAEYMVYMLASGIVDVLDDNEYTGSLVTLLQDGTDFVRNNSKKAWRKVGDGRIEMPDYPDRAVLEGVVNALIHRNYMEIGGEVHIDMFDDRIEIYSPGGMISGISLEGKIY